MSRILLFLSLAFCFVLASNSGFAQGTYITAHFGYGFGSGTQRIAATQNESSMEGIYGSFGEGPKSGASAGHMFSTNIGMELGLSYWPGKTFEWSTTDGPSRTSESAYGSGFVITPAVVISSGMQTVTPYARVGLVLGLLKVTDETTSSETNQPTQEYTFEETGGLAVGYSGAIGVVISTSGTVDFFAEVDLQSVTHSPSTIELTRYTVGGVDELYMVQNTTYNTEESIPIDSRNSVLAMRNPFSSIGITVGMRIDL